MASTSTAGARRLLPEANRIALDMFTELGRVVGNRRLRAQANGRLVRRRFANHALAQDVADALARLLIGMEFLVYLTDREVDILEN